jgi:predicted HNH restriction endonuclease
MKIKTDAYIHCPICNGIMPITGNAKGRLQMFCYNCHTVVFINNPASVELGEFKGNIFGKEKVENNAV